MSIDTYPPLNSLSNSTPDDPATTTSVIGVMMGLAGSITPIKTGRISIVISGDVDNNTVGSGCQMQIRFGTGGAPANGNALTGTVVGGLIKYQNISGQGVLLQLISGRAPFTLSGSVVDMEPGTAYWVDISLAAITNGVDQGVARVRDLSVTIVEE